MSGTRCCGRGLVVAPQPEAVEAGIAALKAGGNAVDAALARWSAARLASASRGCRASSCRRVAWKAAQTLVAMAP